MRPVPPLALGEVAAQNIPLHVEGQRREAPAGDQVLAVEQELDLVFALGDVDEAPAAEALYDALGAWKVQNAPAILSKVGGPRGEVPCTCSLDHHVPVLLENAPVHEHQVLVVAGRAGELVLQEQQLEQTVVPRAVGENLELQILAAGVRLPHALDNGQQVAAGLGGLGDAQGVYGALVEEEVLAEELLQDPPAHVRAEVEHELLAVVDEVDAVAEDLVGRRGRQGADKLPPAHGRGLVLLVQAAVQAVAAGVVEERLAGGGEQRAQQLLQKLGALLLSPVDLEHRVEHRRQRLDVVGEDHLVRVGFVGTDGTVAGEQSDPLVLHGLADILALANGVVGELAAVVVDQDAAANGLVDVGHVVSHLYGVSVNTDELAAVDAGVVHAGELQEQLRLVGQHVLHGEREAYGGVGGEAGQAQRLLVHKGARVVEGAVAPDDLDEVAAAQLHLTAVGVRHGKQANEVLRYLDGVLHAVVRRKVAAQAGSLLTHVLQRDVAGHALVRRAKVDVHRNAHLVAALEHAVVGHLHRLLDGEVVADFGFKAAAQADLGHLGVEDADGAGHAGVGEDRDGDREGEVAAGHGVGGGYLDAGDVSQVLGQFVDVAAVELEEELLDAAGREWLRDVRDHVDSEDAVVAVVEVNDAVEGDDAEPYSGAAGDALLQSSSYAVEHGLLEPHLARSSGGVQYDHVPRGARGGAFLGALYQRFKKGGRWRGGLAIGGAFLRGGVADEGQPRRNVAGALDQRRQGRGPGIGRLSRGVVVPPGGDEVDAAVQDRGQGALRCRLRRQRLHSRRLRLVQNKAFEADVADAEVETRVALHAGVEVGLAVGAANEVLLGRVGLADGGHQVDLGDDAVEDLREGLHDGGEGDVHANHGLVEHRDSGHGGGNEDLGAPPEVHRGRLLAGDGRLAAAVIVGEVLKGVDALWSGHEACEVLGRRLLAVRVDDVHELLVDVVRLREQRVDGGVGGAAQRERGAFGVPEGHRRHLRWVAVVLARRNKRGGHVE
ncbi:uncharacterized protein BcabD6B2_54950 [Babesia caballi]|uniref:Uncharacterized protein n=1 Tax=Babesia caballi TaxID=5871 RepID=A0AAV4M5G2_BABCB|nr:hypothetical protein BcabD6B2_54950 [Babesia caballi]